MNDQFNVNTSGGNISQSMFGGSNNKLNNQTYDDSIKTVPIVQIASDIQDILNILSSKYPITTTEQKEVFASQVIKTIEVNKTFRQRVLSAIQVGSAQAIAQYLNHPVSSFVIAALEDWQKTKEISSR